MRYPNVFWSHNTSSCLTLPEKQFPYQITDCTVLKYGDSFLLFGGWITDPRDRGRFGWLPAIHRYDPNTEGWIRLQGGPTKEQTHAVITLVRRDVFPACRGKSDANI